MDQMLPSPGFSIPRDGTPVHEEDQPIIEIPTLQSHGLALSTSSLLNQQQSVNKAYQTNNMGYAIPHSMIHSLVPKYMPPWIRSVSTIQTIKNPAFPATTPALGTVPQLQNVVSTINLGCQLNLKTIALHARNAEFNPTRFAPVIMRIRNPRTTALIFSSGKVVCTGAKSEEDSKLAARKYARIIQMLNFPAKCLDFKIQNMIGSFEVEFPICLERLQVTHDQYCGYEPELFPGLIFRMVKPRVMLLIFASGKVIITGAKVRQQIYDAYNNICPILKSFQKK